MRERGPAAQTVPDPGNDPSPRERMTQTPVDEHPAKSSRKNGKWLPGLVKGQKCFETRKSHFPARHCGLRVDVSVAYGVSSSLLGPVDLSFRALSGSDVIISIKILSYDRACNGWCRCTTTTSRASSRTRWASGTRFSLPLLLVSTREY